MPAQTHEFTVPAVPFSPAPPAGAKQLVLSILVAAYGGGRGLKRACGRVLAQATEVCHYVRGVHLLVLEKIAVPRVETLRLVTLPAGGAVVKMALVTPGLIEDHIIRGVCWEPHLTEVMGNLMRPDGVFIDVGANIGWHSLHMAARYPGARCHAFEPHPEIFRQLARNTRLSAFQHLTLHQYALGRTSRQDVFYMQDASDYNRGLSSAAPHADMKNKGQEALIRFEPLDNVLSEPDRCAVSLIKIDTQGHEQAVLAGARRTISEARPAIVFEFESRYHSYPKREILEILSLLPNYDVFCVKPGSVEMRKLHVDDVLDSRFEADLVCMPD
jgi:FkbM family methyltransferase